MLLLKLPPPVTGPRPWNGHAPTPEGVCRCGLDYAGDMDAWKLHYADASQRPGFYSA